MEKQQINQPTTNQPYFILTYTSYYWMGWMDKIKLPKPFKKEGFWRIYSSNKKHIIGEYTIIKTDDKHFSEELFQILFPEDIQLEDYLSQIYKTIDIITNKEQLEITQK